MAETAVLGSRELVVGGAVPPRLQLHQAPEQRSPRKVRVLPDTPKHPLRVEASHGVWSRDTWSHTRVKVLGGETVHGIITGTVIPEKRPSQADPQADPIPGGRTLLPVAHNPAARP